MAITSADIQNQSFKIERRGYDVDEVDVFLERVSSEIDALNNEVTQLRNQLKEAQKKSSQAAPTSRPSTTSTKGSSDSATLAQKDARIAELEAKVKECKNEDSAIAQALIVAQRTGDEIVSKAKAEAEQTRQNGEEEARRILDKANAEKERIIEHINELNESRQLVREQYQDLLKEFISSATKRLSEIGGEVTEGFILPENIKNEESSAKWEPSPSTATYTTPTVSSAVSAPITPKPTPASKDLSGYGDADDSFAFDEID